MKFRWKAFGKDLASVRRSGFMTLRGASRRLKVGHATWCRAEQGKPIEAATFVFLCEWMGNNPSIYLPANRRTDACG